MSVFEEKKELLQNSFRAYRLLLGRLRCLVEGMYIRTSDMNIVSETVKEENRCE